MVRAGIRKATGIHQIIPHVVVQRFLESFERHGMFKGFPDLGVMVQQMENPSLRRYYKVQPLLPCQSTVYTDRVCCTIRIVRCPVSMCALHRARVVSCIVSVVCMADTCKRRAAALYDER